MDKKEARMVAARAWCTPTTSSKVMDVELAEAFADILVSVSVGDKYELIHEAVREWKFLVHLKEAIGITEATGGLEHVEEIIKKYVTDKDAQIAEQKAEIERLGKRFSDGFKAGQKSIKRKNESGCCCEVTDEGYVSNLCGAHMDYFEAELARLRRVEEVAKRFVGISYNSFELVTLRRDMNDALRGELEK